MSTEIQPSAPAPATEVKLEPIHAAPEPVHGAAPSAFSPMELPTTAEGAKQQIAARSTDAAFRAALLNGDAAAQAEWSRLNQLAVGEPIAAPDGAAQVKALSGDPEFRKKLLAGDAAAKATWEAANQAAAASADAAAGTVDAPTDIDMAFPPMQNIQDADLSPIFQAGGAIEDAKQWGEALVSARMDRSSASDLVAIGSDAAGRVKTMTPEARAEWASSEYENLIRVVGRGSEDALKEKLALGAQLLDELDKKHAGLRDTLAASGALDDSKFVTRLIRHAERLTARKTEIDGRRK